MASQHTTTPSTTTQQGFSFGSPPASAGGGRGGGGVMFGSSPMSTMSTMTGGSGNFGGATYAAPGPGTQDPSQPFYLAFSQVGSIIDALAGASGETGVAQSARLGLNGPGLTRTRDFLMVTMPNTEIAIACQEAKVAREVKVLEYMKSQKGNMTVAAGRIDELCALSNPESIPFHLMNEDILAAKFQKIVELGVNIKGIAKILQLDSIDLIKAIPDSKRDMMHRTLKKLHFHGEYKGWQNPSFAQYVGDLVMKGIVVHNFPNNGIVYNKEHQTEDLRFLLAIYLKMPLEAEGVRGFDHSVRRRAP
ncbi:MAG: hypothetical protein SGILL_004628 [Bacillariaceae sp.]